VAIGSSTGGTVALEKIISQLPADAPPVIVAQHIPAGFSSAFANRVNAHAPVTVREAQEGDVLEPGTVTIAPGGVHLRLVQKAGRYICRLDDSDTSKGHKPSVNVLFNSLAKISGREMVAVILTGMGKDGADGMKLLHDQGVHTIVQDEKTSVVWGMPKRAVELNAVSEVCAIEDIATAVLEQAY
jgi:two-component system chemotaxis response regulator CheB